MSYIKKHEFLFGVGIVILILAPFLLKMAGLFEFDFSFGSVFLMTIIAAIPAFIWIKIFNKEHHEAKTTLVFAFLAGCTSTIPVFLYQDLFTSGNMGNFIFFKIQAVNFQQNISELFGYPSLGMLYQASGNGTLIAALGVFCVFMGVGVMEELVKQVVINVKSLKWLAGIAIIIAIGFLITKFDIQNLMFVMGMLIIYLVFLRLIVSFVKLRSIDDAIEVAVVAALGFAFVENIHYFIGKFDIMSKGSFAFFVLIRVTVVTVVHVLCSGILGYHIGLAHFANLVLKDELREGRQHPIIKFIHSIIDLPEDKVFKFEQVCIGLFWAIVVHGLYDFFMQMKFSFLGIPAFALIMPLYFIGGIWYLIVLLEDKEDRKEFGQLIVKEEYESGH